jgi:hypothetical protein
MIRLLHLAPLPALVLAVLAWTHLPHWDVRPALLGLASWTVGNYLFVPLRWRAVSTQGRRLRWYSRVYAEGELLGLLTPQHAGTDLWRIKQLVSAGADKRTAVLEVAADRLSGGVMVVSLALLAGMELPGLFWPLAASILVVGGGFGWVLRRRWMPRFTQFQRPSARQFLRGAAVSALYQAGYLGFVIGLVAAVGHHIDPLGAASLLGISQTAGMLPGVHGAGPKEGAMTTGLVALGVPLGAALAAVALGAALTWVPAVVGGGLGLSARAIGSRRRPASQPA